MSCRSLSDGLGTNDFLEHALVLLAGGAANCAAALVLDRVCCAGAMGIVFGVGAGRRLRLMGVLVAMGNWAVVLTILGAGSGAGVGTTLKAGVCIVGVSWDIDLVMCMFVGGLSLSTLGAGCTLGIAGCCGSSVSSVSAVSVCEMSWMSLKSWDVSNKFWDCSMWG